MQELIQWVHLLKNLYLNTKNLIWSFSLKSRDSKMHSINRLRQLTNWILIMGAICMWIHWWRHHRMRESTRWLWTQKKRICFISQTSILQIHWLKVQSKFSQSLREPSSVTRTISRSSWTTKINLNMRKCKRSQKTISTMGRKMMRKRYQWMKNLFFMSHQSTKTFRLWELLLSLNPKTSGMILISSLHQ